MKHLLRIIMPYFAIFEGIMHLIVSSISIWGIFATHTFDWRVMTAPLADLIFGFASLATGWIFKDDAEDDVKL